MSLKLGFIGCGNMGKAMLSGVLESGKCAKADVLASAKTEATREKIKSQFDIKVTADNKEVAEFADVLFLAVKPQYYAEVIDQIKDVVRDDTIVISIAPGKSLEWFDQAFGKQLKVIRTMPNTPALVGEAMTAICVNKNVTKDELNIITSIFNSFGKSEILEEKYFHAFTALCGSSPAYVYMFIEAMADAAVKQGLPRDKAYKMASQAVLGSAKMVLETKENPGKLKDNVCSPGGTTIEAVIELERQGFRNAVISAIEKCEEKSRNM